MVETFKKPTIAWLVTKHTSVHNFVVKRYKISLRERTVADATGHTVKATFVWKGRTCTINSYGEVFWGSKMIAENFKVELSDKMKRDRRTEAACRLACDPNSETYWSM